MILSNKYALVTGASSGIGQSISIQFAKEGANVYLIGRNEIGLKKTYKAITHWGGKAEIIIADLSSIDSIHKLITTIKSKTNRVDILANIAGIWHGKNEVYAGKDFETFREKVIRDTYYVGLITPTLLIHALIPLIPKNGKVLNLSGTFENGAKGWIPYYVSKKALEDLTVGLSQELKEKNIQVNCISPSDTATEAYKKYFPQYIDEAINPQEIAKYAVFLCSSQANSVTGKVFVLKKGNKPFESFHF